MLANVLAFQVRSMPLIRLNRNNDAITEQQHAEKEYREARKASRGRWRGGGFGLGGALKGAATAGALNAVSGFGHDLVNSAGNLSSALDASNAKPICTNRKCSTAQRPIRRYAYFLR